MRVGTPHIVWKRVGEWRDVQRTCGYFLFFVCYSFLSCLYQLPNPFFFGQTYEDAGKLFTTIRSPLGMPGEAKSGVYTCLLFNLYALESTLRRIIHPPFPIWRPSLTYQLFNGDYIADTFELFRNTFIAVNLRESSTRACLRSSYVYSALSSSLHQLLSLLMASIFFNFNFNF